MILTQAVLCLVSLLTDLQEPVNIEVFENYIYWTTSGFPGSIKKMLKNGGEVMTEVPVVNAPAGLKISHLLRQPITGMSFNPLLITYYNQACSHSGGV